MDNKEFDKLFKEAFASAEATPRDAVWRRIGQALDQQKEKDILKPIRHTFHWGYYVAAASVLLAFGVVVWITYTAEHTHRRDKTIAQHEHSQSDAATNTEANTPREPEIIELQVTNTAKKVGTIHAPKGESTVQNKTMVPLREVPKLEILDLNAKLTLHNARLASADAIVEMPTERVTEVEEISPLIEPEEEMKSMYAATTEEHNSKNNIVTSLLNTISAKMETNSNREVRFRTDEEGSIRMDVINPLIKNRNKKK